VKGCAVDVVELPIESRNVIVSFCVNASSTPTDKPCVVLPVILAAPKIAAARGSSVMIDPDGGSIVIADPMRRE